MKRIAVILLALWCATALALSPADKAALKSAIDAAIDALPVDVPAPPPPPPVDPWPSFKPDIMDIDFTGLDAILGAKWLNGNLGYDLKGTAIHYGDMAGPLPITNFPPDATHPNGYQTADYSAKLSGTGYPPVWGVEPSGLHYLESGSTSPRLLHWQIWRFSTPEIYYRFMVYAFPESLSNTTDLGIKLSGPATDTSPTFAEIFELGDVTPTPAGARTNWPLQAYRYDAEHPNSGVTVFPNVSIVPGRWYTMEGHVKVPSCLTCADGVMEFKVDGKPVFARADVKMGVTAITGFQVQIYHGGVKSPAGMIRFRTARVALCTQWCGPAGEIAQ